MIGSTQISRLESLDHQELLQTARRLLAEANGLSSRLSAVNEIGIAMNSTLDLDTIQRLIAKQAKWLLDFEHCSVCLPEDDIWQVVVAFGPALNETQVENLLQNENVGSALRSRQPQLIQNGSPSPFLAGYASQIIIPLVADDIVLGTINFATTASHAYTQDDMRIVYMLSLQLSAAIRNARIFAELKRTQEELQLRVEELDAYGHTIAHDLKSPLSNILLSSELITMRFGENLPPKGLEYLNAIRDSGSRMSKMIDQLLWLAKLRHSSDAITMVEVRTVVDAALERFNQLLDERGISVSVAPVIPPALGHAQWIEEIFANLISNAIKYMGDDNPQPRIEIRGFGQGARVRYEVRDTGVGIQPADQTRLFEMFTRLNNTKAEGLGLGLSIVQRIIHKLNGEVGVESTYGEGSTFWFTLPTTNKSATKTRTLELKVPENLRKS